MANERVGASDDICNVEYSLSKNIILVVYACAITALLLSILVSVLWAVFGWQAIYDHRVPILLMYVLIPLIELPFEMINFIKQHRNCRRYSYKVASNDVAVKDVTGKAIAHIAFSEIERYHVLNIGYSVYEALKVYVKGGRAIVIYRTMTRYRQVIRALKRHGVAETHYKNVRIATYEDNVL